MTDRISVKKTGEQPDKTFPLHMVGALLNVRYGAALCGLIIGLIPRLVSADEIFVPPWRFSPMSTYQTWTFPNATQRAPDRMFNNARGPTGFETPKFEAGGGWEATALGRDGVWALEGTGIVSRSSYRISRTSPAKKSGFNSHGTILFQRLV
jgi:hypothetical protein